MSTFDEYFALIDWDRDEWPPDSLFICVDCWDGLHRRCNDMIQSSEGELVACGCSHRINYAAEARR